MPPRPRQRQHPKNPLEKRPRLTPAIIIARVRAGGRLHKAYTGRARPAFTLDGAPVERHHALAAIESGKLVAVNDALFGDDCQTWEAKC